MGRSLAIVTIWLVVLGGAAAAYKFFILDTSDFGNETSANSTEPGTGKAADTHKTPPDPTRKEPPIFVRTDPTNKRPPVVHNDPTSKTPTSKSPPSDPWDQLTRIASVPEMRISFS